MGEDHQFTIDVEPQILRIGRVVEINVKDGSVRRLDEFTTTEAAAEEFWRAVEQTLGRRLLSAKEG